MPLKRTAALSWMLSMGIVFSHCSTPESPSTKPESLPVQEAAHAGRYQMSKGQMPLAELKDKLTIEAKSLFPVWSKEINASIDVKISHQSEQFVNARVRPRYVILSEDGQTPLVWSPFALSNAYALGPEETSVLSIAVGNQKSFSSPIRRVFWQELGNQIEWPHKSLHEVLSPGHYQCQVVLDVYDGDEPVSSIRSKPFPFELN